MEEGVTGPTAQEHDGVNRDVVEILVALLEAQDPHQQQQKSRMHLP